MKYTDAFERQDGPIGRFEYSTVDLFGVSAVRAFAYLSEGVSGHNGSTLPEGASEGPPSEGPPDGVGVASTLRDACQLASADAIRAWAVATVAAGAARRRYGLDYDSGPAGFAAHPGPVKRPARNAALCETIERHCVACWWEGLLAHRCLPDPLEGVRAIEIDNPFSNHIVVLLWTTLDARHVYSFGAGDHLLDALWRAQVALDRTHRTLLRVAGRLRRSGAHAEPSIFERRLLYFSSAEGRAFFLDRLSTRAKNDVLPLKFIFDGEIPGPWSEWSSVWRTLVEPPASAEANDRRFDYFLWSV